MIRITDGFTKKLVLMGVTFLMAVGAYLVFTREDHATRVAPKQDATEVVRRFVTRPVTSQPVVQSFTEAGLNFSPGDQTRVKIYDEITGRLKYIFEAKSWEPVSESDYRLKDLSIQIYMPRGEITYINADEAEVTLARKTGSRVDPKRGRLWGNVTVTIDRTTAKWREENPELAERYAHADDLIHIHLPEARFDMDRAELKADGDVLVDSVEARIEKCRGLLVQWDQVDNRIDLLRFEHGGRMMLRRGGRMVDFAMPGTVRESRSESAKAAASGAPGFAPKAQAMKPLSIDAISTAEAAAEIRLEGGLVSANQPKSISTAARTTPSTERTVSSTEPNQLRSEKELASAVGELKREARSATSGEPRAQSLVDDALARSHGRVHTYRAVFENQVVVEQLDGLRTIGKVEADQLEVNFDFGKKQRGMASGRSPSQDEKPEGAPTDHSVTANASQVDPSKAAGGRPVALTPSPAPSLADDPTKLVLTWNGPLEMRPIWSAGGEPPTGERFDVVAIGNPVRLMSAQGTQSSPGKVARAACDQLVYRHERRQAWMAGRDDRPVQIHVDDSGRLVGREVFFDQQRGLGRVEGPGTMSDDRGSDSDVGSDSTIFAATSDLVSKASGEDGSGRNRDPVLIKWSRGVDFELGSRRVEALNAATGMREEKNKEFLRRAWFHGDVSIRQGDERLVGDEVAVTFGSPRSGEDVADHISHLSMSGKVRLERGDDVLAGERLDVQMTVTSDGKNLPKVVDAAGDVLARQADREIRAEEMHVEMTTIMGEPRPSPDGTTMLPGRSRVGIDRMDARGDVLVRDPSQNLKISRAESLVASMRNGNELVRATILGKSPEGRARARFGDVAMHGHRIEIDMDEQAIEVPGPGVAFSRTTEDFGGRKLSEPTIVRTTWRDRMEFHLARNYGVFLGGVVSRTDNFSLTSSKLTVRFAKAPPAAPRSKSREFSPLRLIAATREEAAYVDAIASPSVVAAYTTIRLLWGIPQGRLLGRFAGLGDERKGRDSIAYASISGERKQPVYLVAEGNAEALSTEHGPRTRLGTRGRLLSRMRIAADQIAVDLSAQQMNIPCKGSLLIEDYQFDPRERKAESMASSAAGSPMMSSLRSEGPSQTAVTWTNSMDYFVDRNLVVFDRDVTMAHRSGREMVMQGELATAMGIDPDQMLRLGKGRIATLRAGNLLLEFKTPRSQRGKERGAEDTMRATDLQRLIAKGSVFMREDTRSLTGEHLQYMAESGEVRVEGGPGFEATIMEEEETAGRFMMWRGPVLTWDRITGRIEAPKAAVRTSRR